MIRIVHLDAGQPQVVKSRKFIIWSNYRGSIEIKSNHIKITEVLSLHIVWSLKKLNRTATRRIDDGFDLNLVSEKKVFNDKLETTIGNIPPQKKMQMVLQSKSETKASIIWSTCTPPIFRHYTNSDYRFPSQKEVTL